MTTSLLTSDTAELRKARGAFFTPEPVARYITHWGVHHAEDRVLEPSCGEAAFLLSAVERLQGLGAPLSNVRLHGVELHESSAATARSLLAELGVQAEIATGDFFEVTPTGDYDVVIGNPPYVRYQDFTGESRARSREAALRAGVSLTALASSWAAFTVHAALFLRQGGRLGLVLPAELLSVNYAAGVRQFLMERFRRVDLVMFTERVFPGVLEEVVLLLAEGYGEGPADHFSVYQAHNTADLEHLSLSHTWTPGRPGDKWTASIMGADALTAYTAVTGHDAYTSLEVWGDTTLGMVTGNNKYFALSPAKAAALGLARRDLIKISPPGSRHLRGLALSSPALRALGEQGAATYLFRPAGTPSPAGWAYISQGEAAGVHEAYKCRVRDPWWRVPLVRKPDLFVTYMNADTPRITTNQAGVHHLNSVHGIYLAEQHAELGRELLPLASLNSATVLGAELVGRAYGGGMLKLEPREADRLPVPGPVTVAAVADDLRRVRRRVASRLTNGDVAGAVAIVDQVVLTGGLGLSPEAVDSLREAHNTLAARRVARGATGEARR